MSDVKEQNNFFPDNRGYNILKQCNILFVWLATSKAALI